MAKRAFLIVLVVACALLALPPQTFSARPAPKIKVARTDTATGRLTLAGENFGSGTPIVKLAGEQLVVETYSIETGTLVSFLPGGLEPGNYLLELENERGQEDSFVATVFP